MCEDKVRMNSEGVEEETRSKTPVCFSLCLSLSSLSLCLFFLFLSVSLSLLFLYLNPS